MALTPAQAAQQLDRLRAIALALPEATEEVTWGTDVNFRVRKKIFCFPGDGGSITVKADRDELPALLGRPALPAGALPGPWRLDRDGSVRRRGRLGRGPRADPHVSYCLIAPKTLAKQVFSALSAAANSGSWRRASNSRGVSTACAARRRGGVCEAVRNQPSAVAAVAERRGGTGDVHREHRCAAGV